VGEPRRNCSGSVRFAGRYLNADRKRWNRYTALPRPWPRTFQLLP
jgi:hypothetical protein